MKLGVDPADEAFRAELFAFLDEHAPAEIRVGRDWIGDDEDEVDGMMSSRGGVATGRPRCSTTAG